MSNAARSRRQAGFSVLELVISLLIAVEILIAMAIAFDVHNKVSRAQLQITDMQQSLRIAQWDIARMVRQAGRGGLKADLAPSAVFVPTDTPPRIRGRAIEVRDNVQDDEIYVVRGDDEDSGTPAAFPGTDILTVRGCFSTGLYQINSGTFDPDQNSDENVEDPTTIVIPPVSIAGVPQPFSELEDELSRPAVDGVLGRVLISSYVSCDDWGIAKVTAFDSSSGDLVLTVALQNTGTGVNDSPLNPLTDVATGARAFPHTLTASSVCLLEEYRYYIRDVREAGDPITPLRPRLSRARFEPGTETPYGNDDSNLAIDLADQIFDLQVALGVDSDYQGAMDADDDDLGDDDTVYDGSSATDDWLHNDTLDLDGALATDCSGQAGGDLTDCPFVYHQYVDPDDPTLTLDGDPVDVYFVRITTAARTFRPDGGYRAPDLDAPTAGDWLENHNYDDPSEEASVFNNDDNRKHRRRTLTTIVEMRNI